MPNFTVEDVRTFERLNQEFLNYYNRIDTIHRSNLEEWERYQIGSYLMVIDHLTAHKYDFNELIGFITDDKFNRDVFGDGSSDLGIDAVLFDEENLKIKLYNFKYIRNINEASLPPAEISKARVFFDRIYRGNIAGDDPSSKIISFIEKIRERIESGEDWEIIFTFVSNGFRPRSENPVTIEEISRIIENNTLDELFAKDIINLVDVDSNITVNARFQLEKSNIIDFDQRDSQVRKMVIAKLPIFELVRMTTDSEELRLLRNYSLDQTRISVDSMKSCGISMNILRDNIRQYIERGAYNKNVINTLESDISNFIYYNNGLTILVDKIDEERLSASRIFRKYYLHNVRVVNGGQTLRSIHRWFSGFDESQGLEKILESCVLVRIFEVDSDSVIGAKISEYTNSQNRITSSDLMANHPIQVELQKYLKSFRIDYVRQNGVGLIIDDFDIRITKETFAQILFSVSGRPNQATSLKNSLFGRNYELIFNESLDFQDSVAHVNRHQEIIKFYAETDYNSMDIKNFYIHWLVSEYGFEIPESIEKLEDFIRINLNSESKIDRALIANSTLEELIDWLQDSEDFSSDTSGKNILDAEGGAVVDISRKNSYGRHIPNVEAGKLSSYLKQRGKDEELLVLYADLEKRLEALSEGKSGFGQQRSNPNHWTIYLGSRVGLLTIGTTINMKLGFTYKHGTPEKYYDTLSSMTESQKQIIDLSQIPSDGMTQREALVISNLDNKLENGIEDIVEIIIKVSEMK